MRYAAWAALAYSLGLLLIGLYGYVTCLLDPSTERCSIYSVLDFVPFTGFIGFRPVGLPLYLFQTALTRNSLLSERLLVALIRDVIRYWQRFVRTPFLYSSGALRTHHPPILFEPARPAAAQGRADHIECFLSIGDPANPSAILLYPSCPSTNGGFFLPYDQHSRLVRGRGDRDGPAAGSGLSPFFDTGCAAQYSPVVPGVGLRYHPFDLVDPAAANDPGQFCPIGADHTLAAGHPADILLHGLSFSGKIFRENLFGHPDVLSLHSSLYSACMPF